MKWVGFISKLDLLRLNKVQGSHKGITFSNLAKPKLTQASSRASEERVKSRSATLNERQSVTDAAMRQEGWRCFGFAASRPARLKVSGGFTIVEVMMVLAISGIIFAGGIVTLRGQTNSNAFDGAIRDTGSELSNQVRGASSTQFFNSQGYNCKTTGTPPLATLSTSGTATQNQDCVALGIAVEAPSNSSSPVSATLNFYQILGNRLQYIGVQPAGQADSLASSNPTPAVVNGNYLLTTYKLSAGVKLAWAKAVPISGGSINTNLVGFYLGYNNGPVVGANGSQTISGQAYNYTAASQNSADVKACVEAPACGPQPISTWKLCFQNDAGDRQAEIDINNQPTGLTTDVKFANCN